MPKRDIRRHQRIPQLGRVRISWEDASGQPKFTLAKCLDLSESGMRVEATEPIPALTNVLLQAGEIHLSGSAIIKHIARHGSKYILGLELSQPFRGGTSSR